MIPPPIVGSVVSRCSIHMSLFAEGMIRCLRSIVGVNPVFRLSSCPRLYLWWLCCVPCALVALTSAPAHAQAPIARSGTSSPATSIVVMPFTNLSRQPSDAWIGNGIAETVSADLTAAGRTVVQQMTVLSALGTRAVVDAGRVDAVDDSLPTHELDSAMLGDGLWIVKLLVAAGFEKSNGGARRLLQAGGCYVNDERIEDLDRQITAADFTDGRMNLRAGKKNVRRIILRS